MTPRPHSAGRRKKKAQGEKRTAMTRQEWARREVEFGNAGWVALEGGVALSSAFEAVEGSFNPLGATEAYVGTYHEKGPQKGEASDFGVTLTPPRRWAMAALCLDGMKFGFTRVDVDALKAKGLHGLARRIAALLPPMPAKRRPLAHPRSGGMRHTSTTERSR